MIVIGEKINGSLPGVKGIIQERDKKGLLELAERQRAAGVDFIDVNVGTGVGSREDEIISMEWAIKIIQDELDVPISIDSADPAVLEVGLRTRNGRPSLINSANAEKRSLEEVVPLAGRYNSPLVGLAMDETGIPKTAGDRIRACERIAEACDRNGVVMDNLFLDPLVVPISTDIKQGIVTLTTLTEIKKRFPNAKTVLGVSNVSYGLPARAKLNTAFLHMAVYAGLDAAIIDPLDNDMLSAVRTAEALVGKDRHCRRYSRAFRKS